MRKTLLLLSLVLFLSVSIFGCTVPPGPGSAPHPPSDTAPPPGSEHETYPEEVTVALETVKPMQVAVPIIVNGKTYVIVSYGEKPTAGYKAEIMGIDRQGNRLTVRSSLTEPKPGDAVAQVITYPYAIDVVDGVFQEVSFINAAGEEFPQVVGLKGTLNSVRRSANSNIIVTSVTSVPGAVEVAGIARVFEAVVGYELQDEAGQALAQGSVMTVAGGPNWGYFTLDINQVPQGATRLVLFQPSAKDGSKLDVVELELGR
ncbi:Gmad2 immunoglobulin-like domain-containing protein [Desulforudis sp. DRI-14]|uniref:Gmad2 immunoglobulin-like domain-containing protein n=1 Tax=Desulforudis sp. DRI-14 TaxID=3459793 RepID=UPI004041C7A6